MMFFDSMKTKHITWLQSGCSMMHGMSVSDK